MTTSRSTLPVGPQTIDAHAVILNHSADPSALDLQMLRFVDTEGLWVPLLRERLAAGQMALTHDPVEGALYRFYKQEGQRVVDAIRCPF